MQAAQDVLLVQNILTKRTPTACWIHFPLTCMSPSTSSGLAPSGMPYGIPSELMARYRILIYYYLNFSKFIRAYSVIRSRLYSKNIRSIKAEKARGHLLSAREGLTRETSLVCPCIKDIGQAISLCFFEC